MLELTVTATTSHFLPFVLSQPPEIGLLDLPENIRRKERNQDGSLQAANLQEALRNVEKDWLERAIKRYGKQSDIAMELGVSQPTVARMLKRHGLAKRT